MQIKSAAFGNLHEAFIEERLKNCVNIIYSDDNNKGKTLLVQAILYALGNSPVFPSGFDKDNYYFYTKIDIKNMEYEFLRKGDSVIVKTKGDWLAFDSISELKYYIHKNLFSLPVIKKNGEDKVVDLELFYQLFSIGQDKRDTSKIQNSGYYNKSDFMSMLRGLEGLQGSLEADLSVEQIKKTIDDKKKLMKLLRRKMELVKKNPDVANYASKYADREDVRKHEKSLIGIHQKISKYKKSRSREINRRLKLQNLISELNSLNQTISMGKIICSECGSEKIIYSNGSLNFEISNSHVKKKVLESIRLQISLKLDIEDELTRNINREQDYLLKELGEVTPEVRNILIFSKEIVSEEQYSSNLLKLDAELISLKEELSLCTKNDSESKNKYKEMVELILSEMNRLYQIVDPSGKQVFEALFSKSGVNYSGSEEQEFYFCKLLALNNYFKHDFPIIMDSFRSGELSTDKEQIMIKLYKSTNKQVILTSTLKSEEYAELKYSSIDDINAIDYSQHQNSQVLQASFAGKFKVLLEGFGIAIG